jgi:carbon-monoxide dehydrogenase iron sulfur subunit
LRQVKLNPERCVMCESCVIACALGHSESQDINEFVLKRESAIPRLRIKTKNKKVQIVRCRHCKKPLCIEVCESGAIYKKEGYVVIDRTRCDGCGKCVDACPYRALFREDSMPVPVKCDSCPGAEPACIAACHTGALYLSEEEDEGD